MTRPVLLVVAAVVVHAAAAADRAPAPPVPTGRLEYRIAWNGISAASATVDVTRDGTAQEPVYRVDAAVRTSWMVDLLWRFRGRVAASFTADDLVPRGFRYDRDMNREHSLTDVTFDRTAVHATGTHYHRGEPKVLDVQEPGVVDPITAIFRALSQPVQVGDGLHYDVFTGEARYRVALTIIGEEPVRVGAGTFNAWKVEPQVWKIGTGVDRRLRGATIWVSQAPPNMVLRIRSEVFIGAVTCDLVRVTPLQAQATGNALGQLLAQR